ncbi:calcium-binding protein [Baekduia sp. Peel2402]|uniref:calcium-binding protein n=1 Tax=Baekduia sp. Peel2402 TaxID=3458296 RepID=UPI00403E763A
MRHPLLPLALVLSMLLALAAAGGARAGTISVSGTVITFQAAPGEKNFLTVNWGNVGAGPDYIPSLDDHYDVTPGPGCSFSVSLGAQCPSAGTNPTFIVHLGDQNDIASSMNDHAAGHHVELYGEDGDDDLESDASSDLLDGGPGNDELTADEDEAGPGDVIVGGPGEDTLQTGNPTGTNGPIAVSFDGVANDGYPGENDNYGVDMENLSAPSTAPSINFVGNDGRNVVQLRSESADTVKGLGGDDLIDGANGNDVLDGGEGNDTIYGGGNDDTITGGPGLDSLSGEGSASGLFISIAGNDRIDARDGIAENLNCGPGADTAIVDAIDVVPLDPGSLCEVVDRGVLPPPPTAAPAAKAATVRSTKLKASKSRKTIPLALACPTGAATCKGKLSLKSGKTTVASASYTIAAGKKKTVSLKTTSKGRSLLKRKRSVRVKLTVAPSGAKAITKTLTLRR